MLFTKDHPARLVGWLSVVIGLFMLLYSAGTAAGLFAERPEAPTGVTLVSGVIFIVAGIVGPRWKR